MQQLKRCPYGHFYDPGNHAQCPHCDRAEAEDEVLEPAAFTMARPAPGVDPDEARTVGVTPLRMGLDPVVGWLVCTDGVNKGRDYRIHAERNYIGRGDGMDIHITNDNAISRENHACLSFDPRNTVFHLIPGLSRNIVYINGQELTETAALKARDVIEIGKSTFVFIPFCDEQTTWG